MDNNRSVTWDYARGIAITMIVLHHLYARFFECTNARTDSTVYLCCYTMQLPIFMYVSGLLSRSSVVKNSFSSLLANRAIRLLLPFISFIIIWFLIDSNRFASVWANDFKDGYWFTFVLYEIIVVYAVLYYLSTAIKIRTIYLILFFGVLLTIYKYYTETFFVNRILSINLVWHYCPFFFLGVYSNILHHIINKQYSVLYLSIFVVSQYYYMNGYHFVLPVCNCSSLLFLLSIFVNGIRPAEKIFAMIGCYSLQIYLIHYFFRLYACQLPDVETPWIEFVLFMIISFIVIFISIAVSRLLMKSNILALVLFGVKKRTGII